MTASAPLLSTEGLGIARGRRRLAAGVSVEVAAGEAVHLAGANGSGKTTMLQVFGGLLRPVDGRVVRRAACAFVPEKVALIGALRCGEWLEGMWRLRNGRAAAPDWSAALADAGLEAATVLRAPSATLSKGMLQRVALIEAFNNGAGLVLLDEPFTGLDPEGRAHLVALADGHRARGGAVVVTDHAHHLTPTVVWRLADCRLDAGAPGDDADVDGTADARLVVVAAVRGDERVVVRHVSEGEVDAVLVALIGAGWHVEEVGRA